VGGLVLSRADNVLVEALLHTFRCKQRPSPPPGVILGLVPRTQGAAGFVGVEQAFGAG
jgi:hypothetical protein